MYIILQTLFVCILDIKINIAGYLISKTLPTRDVNGAGLFTFFIFNLQLGLALGHPAEFLP